MGKTRFDFSGQVVVITGGAKGIGKGAADAFGDAGAKVYVMDLDATAGEALVAMRLGFMKVEGRQCR